MGWELKQEGECRRVRPTHIRWLLLLAPLCVHEQPWEHCQAWILRLESKFQLVGKPETADPVSDTDQLHIINHENLEQTYFRDHLSNVLIFYHEKRGGKATWYRQGQNLINESPQT